MKIFAQVFLCVFCAAGLCGTEVANAQANEAADKADQSSAPVKKITSETIMRILIAPKAPKGEDPIPTLKNADLKKAMAENGDKLAQYEVAKTYAVAGALPQNEKKAFKLFEASAKQGFTPSIYECGRCYEFGIGVERDMSKALEYYEKAAAADFLSAFIAAAYINLQLDTPESNKKAFELLKKGDAAYVPECSYNLALLYSDGKGTDKDEVKALEYFKKSASMGIPQARLRIAKYYLGQGDETPGLRWLGEAALGDDQEAKSMLAPRYEKGLGVPQNMQIAVNFYLESAEAGFAQSQYKAGQIYEKGINVKPSLHAAFYWYQKALENGFEPAAYEVARCQEFSLGAKVNHQEAYKNYLRAARSKDPRAYDALGRCNRYGIGVAPDPKTAYEYYKAAADASYAPAYEHLAFCLNTGFGVKADDGEALVWFKKSADAGFDDGAYGFAGFFFDGRGGLSADPKRAISIWEGLAAKGHKPSIRRLIEVYSAGAYADEGKARYWTQKIY